MGHKATHYLWALVDIYRGIQSAAAEFEAKLPVLTHSQRWHLMSPYCIDNMHVHVYKFTQVQRRLTGRSRTGLKAQSPVDSI